MKLESKKQSEIIKFLKTIKNSVVYKHPPYPTGIPDIHFVSPKFNAWFEVKRTLKDKPTQIQFFRHKKLLKSKENVFVVRSVEEVKKICEVLSIIKVKNQYTYAKELSKMEQFEVTEKKLEQLKKSYNSAVSNDEYDFRYDGNILITSYAPYLIEYMEEILKQQKEGKQ